MVHIQSNDSQKKFKDENRKREEELRHIQDIREHLEGKLASANQLCAVLRNTVIQLTQKEKKDRLRLFTLFIGFVYEFIIFIMYFLNC